MSYSHNTGTYDIIATLCIVASAHVLFFYIFFLTQPQRQYQKQPRTSLKITFINNKSSDVSSLRSTHEKKTHTISQNQQEKNISDNNLKNINKSLTKSIKSETHTKQEPIQQSSSVKTEDSKNTSTEKNKPLIIEDQKKTPIKTNVTKTTNNRNKDHDNTSDKSSDSNVAFGALLQNKRFHHVNQHNLAVIGTSQNTSNQTVSQKNNSKQHNSHHHDGQQQDTTTDENIYALSDEEMEKILDEWLAEENALLTIVPMAQIVTEAVVTYPPMETSRKGFVIFEFIIDTFGKVIVDSIVVIDTTDSEFIEPVTQALLESTFKPVMTHDNLVTVNTVRYQFNLTPPIKKTKNK